MSSNRRWSKENAGFAIGTRFDVRLNFYRAMLVRILGFGACGVFLDAPRLVRYTIRNLAVEAEVAVRYARITSTKLILEMEGVSLDHIEVQRIFGMARRMKTTTA